jgi:hypothetical protein
MRETTRELLDGAATVGSAAIIGVLLGLLMLTSGCCSFQPKYCEQCPPEVVEVIVEKWVVERHHIDRVKPPELTSAWSDAEAEADPQGWAEALLADLGAWVNAFFDIDGRVAASNAVGDEGGAP